MALALVQALAGIRLNCRNPATSADFYIEGLGFSRLDASAANGIVALTLGDCRLDLAPLSAGASALPVDAPGWSLSFQHFAIAVASMEVACARLQDVADWSPISSQGPQLLPASSGGVTAYKFRDPDGHPLELIMFPIGTADRPLPRIDHSAISVADTATSVRFYGGLGLAISASTLNHGPEQDRLDGLRDACVEVTALTVPDATGPHLELLCYRGGYPRTRRASAPGDLVSTTLVLEVADRDLLRSVAAGYAAFHTASSLHPESLILHDPDGHLLKIGVATSPSSQ